MDLTLTWRFKIYSQKPLSHTVLFITNQQKGKNELYNDQILFCNRKYHTCNKMGKSEKHGERCLLQRVYTIWLHLYKIWGQTNKYMVEKNQNFWLFLGTWGRH
jgi:hypothetical protein